MLVHPFRYRQVAQSMTVAEFVTVAVISEEGAIGHGIKGGYGHDQVQSIHLLGFCERACPPSPSRLTFQLPDPPLNRSYSTPGTYTKLSRLPE